ncbi:MAG: family 78 glycoside hydrolase catalytic domain, partial [Propionicimonas sp.]
MPNCEAPTDLRIDHHAAQARVLAVGSATPQISWKVPAADPGWRQQRYELKVTRRSGERVFQLDDSEQLFVPWPDAPLASRESALVQVRVCGGQDWSGWSAPVEVEAGLLHDDDWQADFISPVSGATFDDPAPDLFGVWHLDAEPTAARLYVSAHGLYEIYLNGTRVGDELLAPGWTSYHNRLRYQTHDVTSLLHAGDNEVRAVLGNGWWRGHLTWMMQRAVYGDRLALLAQLEVSEDGGARVLVADESFRSRPSGILSNDLYNGQTTDLRGGSGETVAVEKLGRVPGTLVAPDGPPVRVVDVLPAATISTSPTGKLLIDFGQNLVGWVRLRVRNQPAGHAVTVKHAEVLENGELGTRPLRNAKCTDTYFLAGKEEESLEPSFTFHGFRYAQVEGLDAVAPQDVEAVVVSSDHQRAGWFESSDELLNRFHENVVWGMRGNFVDVPTDCPQRDERLGWTGDIQVFAPTAQF